jgi:hypothetical protein
MSYVLPNITNFWNPYSLTPPLVFCNREARVRPDFAADPVGGALLAILLQRDGSSGRTREFIRVA